MLSDTELEQLINHLVDECIDKGKAESEYAWHYIDEDEARGIIEDALYQAINRVGQTSPEQVRRVMRRTKATQRE